MSAVGYTGLVEGLAARNVITGEWEPAFRAVPRHLFAPARIWVGRMADQLIDRVVDPRGWEQAVASDIPLTTHHSAGRDGGRVPRSSCSMPYMVATMLAHLDARPPMRVLEVGTGTGWNAALLAARLGEANVTTVELDSQIAGEAEHAVAAAGYRPHLVVGDGAAGHPPGAPYDRVIATCAVQQLPAAWLAQTRPGGIILTPWGTPYHNGVLLRLEVQPDGHAVGRVVDDATFMWISSQPAIADLMPHIHHADQATVSTTRLDPRGALHEDAAFTIGLHLPGVSHLVGHGTGDEADELTLWLADPDTGSWAAVDYQPDHDEFEVTQYGPRRLWEETEHAYRWWWDAGTPTRFRYGLTVTPTGQHHLWLDQPSHPVFPRVAYNAGSMNACPPAPA